MEKPKTKPNQPPPPQKKSKTKIPKHVNLSASTKGSAVKALLPKHGAWNPGGGGWLRAHWGRGTLNQGCFCSMKTTFAPWSVISLSKCQTRWEHVITGSCCLACFLDSFDFFFFLKIYFLYIIRMCTGELPLYAGDKLNGKWGRVGVELELLWVKASRQTGRKLRTASLLSIFS